MGRADHVPLGETLQPPVNAGRVRRRQYQQATGREPLSHLGEQCHRLLHVLQHVERRDDVILRRDTGKIATQLLEFISPQSRQGEFSSAAVFSAVASMQMSSEGAP